MLNSAITRRCIAILSSWTSGSGSGKMHLQLASTVRGSGVAYSTDTGWQTFPAPYNGRCLSRPYSPLVLNILPSHRIAGGAIRITFQKPQSSVATGQVATMWHRDWCLGCGVITATEGPLERDPT